MTLNELCTEWIETYQKDNIKRQTYIKYKSIIKNYINPAIGDKEIAEFTRRDIQEFVNKLKQTKGSRTGKCLSPAIVNGTLTVLKLVFGYAVDFELLPSCPTDRVRGAKKAYTNKVKCFTLDEQTLIEKYCYEKNSISWFGILLDLYTGMRIGELLALEWDDIDFETGILHVTKTLYISKDDEEEWKEMIDTPKTRTSYRDIPLPSFILERLVEYKKTANIAKCNRIIVHEDDGRSMQTRIFRWRYNKMLEDLNIRHLSFHTLRHTFATRALESGMDVKTLADILGHANPTITLMVYAHAMNDHKIAAMQLIKPLVNAPNSNINVA